MSNSPDTNGVQYIPDPYDLVVERRGFVVRQEPGLVFDSSVQKEGGESVVDNVILEGRRCVLKVSKMSPGMCQERNAFLDFRGFSHTPELIRDYIHQNVVIALLVDRFDGVPFREFLSSHPEMALLFFQNLRKAINDFHGRGFGAPDDWLKPGNLLVAKDATCSFVDLGAVIKPSPGTPPSFMYTVELDHRSFRATMGEFLDTPGLRRKFRKPLEKFWLKDKILCP